jgi:hypothetical protein
MNQRCSKLSLPSFFRRWRIFRRLILSQFVHDLGFFPGKIGLA